MVNQNAWKIVTFLASLVGFIGYGITGSFHIFQGSKKALKICLYFNLAFCTWMVILFSHRFPRSEWFECATSFAVFAVTILDSFYLELHKTSPDMWIIVGSAAFSIMSISLSRAYIMGFYIDLTYFFLGMLVLQLGAMKPVYVTLGIAFGVCIFGTRYWLTMKDKTELLNNKQLSTTARHLLLKLVMNDLHEEDSKVFDGLFEKVIHYLQGISTDLPLIEHSFLVENMSVHKLNDLIHIGSMMLRLDVEETEFSNGYYNWRHLFVAKFLNQLLPLGYGVAQQIGMWSRASHIALEILLPCEKLLCEVIFLNFLKPADLCYTKLCVGAKLHLLNLVKDYVKEPPSPSLLFNMADIYESVPLYLNHPFNSSLLSKATQTLDLVGKTAKEMWLSYGNLICSKMGFCLIGGSTITMDYIIASCRSDQIRSQVIQEHAHAQKVQQ